MNVTIGLSDQNAAEIEAQARAARMPSDRYLAEIIAHAPARHLNEEPRKKVDLTDEDEIAER